MAKFFKTMGIVFGVLSIVFGIIVLKKGIGYIPDYVTFGGDFYTCSYKAIRTVASNIVATAKVLRLSFGFLLLAFGGADICYFGLKCEKTSANITSIDIPADKEAQNSTNEISADTTEQTTDLP